MRYSVALFFAVTLVWCFAQPARADNERLVRFLTTLPVSADHVADITIRDRDGFVVFAERVVGSVVDIQFPFAASDLTGNGVVDFDDFFRFADAFGEAGNVRSDFDRDGVVDFNDFFRFADQFGYALLGGSGKPVGSSERCSFADKLERYAGQFGADLSDPRIRAEIARLHAKLSGSSEFIQPQFGLDMSGTSVLLYNSIGQNVSNEPSRLASGVYIAVLEDAYTQSVLGAAKLTLLDGRLKNSGLPLADYVRQEVARASRLGAVRSSAKTAALVELSFNISIQSAAGAFAPVQFRLTPQPGQTTVSGSIEALTGGAVIIHRAPQPITGLATVTMLPGGASRISVASLFTVSGTLQSARILGASDKVNATLDALTLVVSGDTGGDRGQVSVEATDDAGLSGTTAVSVRSPVITHSFSVSPANATVAYGAEESVPDASGTLATLYDGAVAATEQVEPVLISAVRGVERYEDGSSLMVRTYAYGGMEAMQRIIVAALPNAAVQSRLTRYTSALASGRDMDIRVDVSAGEPVSQIAQALVTKDGAAHSAFTVDLNQFVDPSRRWADIQFSVPVNTATRTVAWKIVFAGETLRGGSGTSFVEFSQDAALSEPEPPQPQPQPEPEPPPTPTPVGPSIAAATANGVAAGGTVIVTAGSLIALSASVSGTPAPSATWSLVSNVASGATASIVAASGSLTLTVSNSAGTQTRTWTVVALGAP